MAKSQIAGSWSFPIYVGKPLAISGTKPVPSIMFGQMRATSVFGGNEIPRLR